MTIVRDGFHWTQESWGAALRSSALGRVATHFFTSRQLWLRGEHEDRDWETVAATIGVAGSSLVRLTQVHGRDVLIVRRGAQQSHEDGRPSADIVVSDDPEVGIVVQVADCVPLLLADARTGAVAAAHAGWRGTQQGVAAAAVSALRESFGSRVEDLYVAHGPSIGPCCYEVGPEVRDAFLGGEGGQAAAGWFGDQGDGKYRLDLWAANREQLVRAGVGHDRIHQANCCTACHPEWFPSYRRDGPGTGRIAAVIRRLRR